MLSKVEALGVKSSLLVVSASLRSSKPTNLWKCDHHSSSSVLPDPHAGSGESHPGRYDGELHQHLPAGGHAGTMEGTRRSPERVALVPLALLHFLRSLSLSLHQGVSLTAQRAAIVVGVELPAYDITKKHLILSGYMGDTVYTHFL